MGLGLADYHLRSSQSVNLCAKTILSNQPAVSHFLLTLSINN